MNPLPWSGGARWEVWHPPYQPWMKRHRYNRRSFLCKGRKRHWRERSVRDRRRQ